MKHKIAIQDLMGFQETKNSQLSGSYSQNIQGIDCEMMLRLDADGSLRGWFWADGECLSILGNVPNSLGEAFCSMHSQGSAEILAVLQINPSVNGITFFLDVPQPGQAWVLSNATRIEMQRVQFLHELANHR